MEKVRYMISDAANIVNVESHVLRYWEDELELNVPRNELGHRYYTKENIQEFQRIKELKEQGYQLKAIRMIVHNMSPDAQAEVGTAHPGIKQDLHQVAYTQDEKAVKAEHQSGQVTRIQDGYAAKQDQHADLNPYTDSGRNMPVSAQHENQSVLDNTDKMAQFTELMTQIVGTAIAANNQELSRCISEDVGEQVIKEMLFEPLDMDSSANFLFGDLESRLVKNYYLKPGKTLADPDCLTVPDKVHEASFVGPLGTVPGFARVITNCRDYTKLMQMLANGGIHNGEHILGRKTIDLIRTNTLTPTMIKEDFSNDYLAGYGYGYGMRTLMNRYEGQHNGMLGQFGWTGGSGTWAECDPETGLSIVYMHNLQPNLEQYHHLRMREVAYGCL